MMLRRILSSSTARFQPSKAHRQKLVWTSTSAALTTTTSTIAPGAAHSNFQENHRRQHGLLVAAAGAAVASGLAYNNNKNTTTDCCGIAGVVGTPNHDARDFLLEGLTVLKNRGYDSAGLATMPTNGGEMVSLLFAGTKYGLYKIVMVYCLCNANYHGTQHLIIIHPFTYRALYDNLVLRQFS